MKNTAVLLFLFLLSFSCKGQNNKSTYAQQSDLGLEGTVKKVTQYFCPVENNIIPEDTTNYTTKKIITYDSLGNISEAYNIYKSNNEITAFTTIYSGTGKNRTFIMKFISGTVNKQDKSYRCIWSDDYHFKVVPTGKTDSSELMATYTLDKDFRIIKTTFTTGDNIQSIDEFEYIGKGKRIYKKTYYIAKEERIMYSVQIAQEYDTNGSPTITYLYNDKNTKKIAEVCIQRNEYYETARLKNEAPTE